MILWIVGRVPSLNELLDAKAKQRGKWNRYNDIKANWASQVKLAAVLKRIGLQPPGCGTFLFCEPDQRRDPDNVVGAGVKLLLDSLVAADVLGGDGWHDNLGFCGYWTLTPGRAGCLIHWGDEILTKPEMLALLEKEKH